MLTSPVLSLGFNLTLADLYDLTPTGSLTKVDQAFQNFLQTCHPTLRIDLEKARAGQLSFTQQSQLMIDLAPWFEDFIGELFNIRQSINTLQSHHQRLAPLITVKRQFVQRFAIKTYPNPEPEAATLLPPVEDELAFAQQILLWQDNHETESLDKAARYAAWATLTPAGQKRHGQSILFKVPRKIDPSCLIPAVRQDEQGVWQLPIPYQRFRQGFNLTDQGFDRPHAFDHSHYCIHCHRQNKDSCSKGFKAPPQHPDRFTKNATGTLLTGCPLEQKISEMNTAKAQGYTLAALAIITVDNPLVAATGHRICNDCMKACIYQKQEPVNIPAVETQILQEVLHLPWGFEIYSLLTRWNPLNFSMPLASPATGRKVLVAGMGPAGFSLAHYLLNEGHTVVGIDGLKIEPLPPFLTQSPFVPIDNIESLYESLDERITGGFGGVAEYGITVRWDKNFLKIIRLILERRQRFQLWGGIRLGGTLTIDQAFDLNFDHVALCLGAGRPTLLDIENGFVPGVRQASDFLMALQLTGAAKKDSIANLQVRLPIVVIGGGLTAIDTATEALAYYPRQAEKFLQRYQALVAKHGSATVRQHWNEQETIIAEELLSHGTILQSATPAEKQEYLKKWGNSTVIYRRPLQQAPSYRLNPEEVEKALQEGITILDQAVPLKVCVDQYGHAEGLIIHHQGIEKKIPARTILIAAGTQPNTNLRYDIAEQIVLTTQGKTPTFQAINDQEEPVSPEPTAKPKDVYVLMRYTPHGQSVSFFGDLHPSFAGNVVKAIASAKKGYPLISRALQRSNHNPENEALFLTRMRSLLSATIHRVERLTSTIIEIVIKAPLAARSFQPGQFYRLQNFETLAPKIKDTRLAMEGLALTGASVDREKGLLSTIVLEMGGSSSLCHLLKPGEPVVLMGPTGAATALPKNETVLLIGGGLGNAVLFSIGQALQANGCRVLYAAGYKTRSDRYKIEEIEKAATQILWCCDEEPGFKPTRAHDLTFVGNLVQGITAYGKGYLGKTLIPLSQIQRLLVIGSDRMMAAVAKARHHEWQGLINPHHRGIGSINSPMQCMMKEICGQCLQIHKDPLTGIQSVVYSCVNQDQSLDTVDFNHLRQRLAQNSVQEKLTSLWVKYCLEAS